MSITVDAFAVLLLLVPGFLTSKMLNAIAVRRGKGHMAEIKEALVFSFLQAAARRPPAPVAPGQANFSRERTAPPIRRRFLELPGTLSATVVFSR